MPLRPARVGRVGVIGHPVAKTAVVAKAVSPWPRAGSEDGSRGSSRHTREGGSPPPDLAPGWCTWRYSRSRAPCVLVLRFGAFMRCRETVAQA